MAWNVSGAWGIRVLFGACLHLFADRPSISLRIERPLIRSAQALQYICPGLEKVRRASPSSRVLVTFQLFAEAGAASSESKPQVGKGWRTAQVHKAHANQSVSRMAFGRVSRDVEISLQ